MTFTEEEFARYLRLQFFVGALSTQKTIGRAGRDDWGELLRWVNEGERAKQKVAELTSTVDALKTSNRKAIAQADAAEQQAADMYDELEREREKAQRIEHDVRAKLEGTVTALTAERDGLKTALDETKTELAEVRQSHHDESSALRVLAAELGLTADEIAKLELEGKLFGFVRAEIKSRVEAERQEKSDKSRLLDLYSVIEESGLYPTRKDPETWRDGMEIEEQQKHFMNYAETLVESWVKHRPERLAVRALTEEQRRVIADDKAHLEQKSRPMYARRVDLLNRLGELPANFIESGALSYRDDWDQKLGDDTIDVARFDAFVEMQPRVRQNASVDSLTKLSKITHTDKRTLYKYARLLAGTRFDLSRWLAERATGAGGRWPRRIVDC